MHIHHLVILAFGLLGGLAELNATAHAAPLPVAPMAAQTAEAPLVAKAYYYGYRLHWRPRRYYRPYYFRPRPYWHRRHHWHRRFY